MAEAKEPPQDSATSKADAIALLEEAEAEAAAAEALAAAARARARAAPLRREAQAQAEAEAAAKTGEEAPEADEDATGEEPQTEDGATGADEDATEADVAETEEAVSDDSPEDAEPEPEAACWWRRLRLPSLSVTWKAAAVILICAFIGASGYMMWQRHETTERNQRAANFVAGAKQGVINMFSLDFNRAKEDVQRVIDSSTGQFRDDFQQRAKDFTTVVEQSKVVTQGTMNAAAVQSMDGNSALVLVAASSRITNAAGAKDEPRNWRLKVTVTEDGGQFKMSKLEFVP